MSSSDNMLTVAELIELLQDQDPEAYVVLSSDSEGNNYSPVVKDFGKGVYVPDTSYSGELYAGRKITPELELLNCTEEDCYDEPDAIDAIVIYPTN